jgi:hypothetical protein
MEGMTKDVEGSGNEHEHPLFFMGHFSKNDKLWIICLCEAVDDFNDKQHQEGRGEKIATTSVVGTLGLRRQISRLFR